MPVCRRHGNQRARYTVSESRIVTTGTPTVGSKLGPISPFRTQIPFFRTLVALKGLRLFPLWRRSCGKVRVSDAGEGCFRRRVIRPPVAFRLVFRMPARALLDQTIIGMIAQNLVQRRNSRPCRGYPPGALLVRGVTWMPDGRVTLTLTPRFRNDEFAESRCPLAEFPPETSDFVFVIEDETEDGRTNQAVD